jgi:hypothetical protein
MACLAEAEKQEPVAWATFDGEGNYDFMSYEGNENYSDEYVKRNGKKYTNWVLPLYTAPPKRENELDIADRAYFAGKKDGIDETIALIRSKNK